MRIFKVIFLMAATTLLLLTSCDPIEDRESLSSIVQPDKIDLSVEHSEPGSNLFTLKMNTPGVTGYWDYTIDKGFGDELEVLYPITGTQTFYYIVSSGYFENGDLNNVEYVTKSIDVEITQLDKEVPEEWGNLVGDGSKAWTLDQSEEHYWYMTDADPDVFWWQPADPPSDVDGKIVFDLEGSPGFTYYASPDAEPVGDTKWVFGGDFTKLTLVGEANILGVEDGGVQNEGLKEYEILELTEDRLVLFISDVAWSPGWVWVFKPVEE